MEIAFIDHYDSFSYNLIDWLGQASPSLRIRYIAKDDLKLLEFLKVRPIPTVISPGPGHPSNEEATLGVLQNILGRAPVLGVCLGHQMLGLLAGGTVTRARFPRHGGKRTLKLDSSSRLFDSLTGDQLEVAAYNSLAVEDIPEGEWFVSARCAQGEIQAIENRETKWLSAGIQFHPESHLSALQSIDLAKRWIASAQEFYA